MKNPAGKKIRIVSKQKLLNLTGMDIYYHNLAFLNVRFFCRDVMMHLWTKSKPNKKRYLLQP